MNFKKMGITVIIIAVVVAIAIVVINNWDTWTNQFLGFAQDQVGITDNQLQLDFE